MIDRIRRSWRRLTGTCPGCGYPPGETVTAVVDVDEEVPQCNECGSPHIIMGVMRCPTCYALLDDNEILYPDDEMEYQHEP